MLYHKTASTSSEHKKQKPYYNPLKFSVQKQTCSIRLLKSAFLQGGWLFSWAQKWVWQSSPLWQKLQEQAQHKNHHPCSLRLISAQHSLEFGTTGPHVFCLWVRQEESSTTDLCSALKLGLNKPRGKTSILFLCWHQPYSACLVQLPWNTASCQCGSGAGVDNWAEHSRLTEMPTSLKLEASNLQGQRQEAVMEKGQSTRRLLVTWLFSNVPGANFPFTT